VDLDNPARVLFDINKVKYLNAHSIPVPRNYMDYEFGDRVISESIDGWQINDFVLNTFFYGSRELAASLTAF